MPIILIVDDSEIDRKLVAGILARDIDWLVEYAENGREAVNMIADISPDIIISDLQMPEMDGIQLCKVGREKFPHIPVIVTTGKGSEDLALEALKVGAASYVPKSSLAETLPVTVEQMLVLANKNRSRDRLMKFTTNCRYQFRIDNDPTLIPPLIDFICDSMKLLRFGDESIMRHVSVSVEEALLNALFHGNLEFDESQARQARQNAVEETDEDEADLVALRSGQSPYNERKILFGVDMSRNKAQFVIRDQGNGFDTKSLPAPDDASKLAAEKRRGLMLIRNFMDEVTFNDEGNEIRMAIDLQKQMAHA